MVAGEEHHVVIIGGGFGGLHAAQALRRAAVRATLVDRRNFHLFQPLLYQVATGTLSPANIAAPLRAVLKRQKNTRVVLSEVTSINLAGHRVMLTDGELSYDSLIVATGATHHYFGNHQWSTLAPGLKTIEDATNIRRRILVAFEAAERELDPSVRRAWLTFVIVGAGPTGVELAGALAEIAHHTLRENFRNIDPGDAQIILVEGAERVLPAYVPQLSVQASGALARIGVTVRSRTTVIAMDPVSVTVRCDSDAEHIPARTVLWSAGVQASPLGSVLAQEANATLDRAGRVIVEPDCSLRGHPEVFVIGDLASYTHQGGKPLPGIAPVAMQQGRYVATLIERRLRSEDTPAFHYHHRGSMAVIGRGAAVAEIGSLRFNGFAAWLAWLFVHLALLIQFDNRVLVLLQWAWHYFTWNRSARLITGDGSVPPAREGIGCENDK